MNEGIAKRFPFLDCVHDIGEDGDVGCESSHESDQFLADWCHLVMLVSSTASS